MSETDTPITFDTEPWEVLSKMTRADGSTSSVRYVVPPGLGGHWDMFPVSGRMVHVETGTVVYATEPDGLSDGLSPQPS